MNAEDIIKLLKNAFLDERGYKGLPISIDISLLKMIAEFSNGDAQTAINVLELAVATTPMKPHTILGCLNAL